MNITENMNRYILTGAPGSGKTTILRSLELTGCSVVAEAATDIIAYEQARGNLKPWENKSFIDTIIRVQKHRQIDMCGHYSDLHFYDRSPICTYALAMFLGHKPTDTLIEEIERIREYNIYENKVFFIENLGFIENTNARKINFKDALRFEQIHKDSYEKFK